MRRLAGLTLATAMVAVLLPPAAQAAATSAVVTATAPKVDVRAKGAHKFAKVANTKKVKAGTTVRTGATGLAEIDYGDGSYTRLDNRTKLVIKKLTDNAGARSVKTALLSGQTFNRVRKLSESESFVQTTSGVAAGVVGTTFAVKWNGTDTSTYTAVSGTVTLRVRGETAPVELTARQRVDIVDGTPGTVETLTPAELAADPWIAANQGPVQEIAAGQFQSCALMTDGTEKCWGDNTAGALGDGTYATGSTRNFSPTPVAVVGLSDVTAISTGGNPTAGGYQHSCAVLADGSARCWGYNNGGQLGAATGIYSGSPVTVAGLTGATAVSVNDFHSCALLADGSVKCWGGNSKGELGDGTTTKSTAPVAVAGLPPATAITTGYQRSCALLADGTVMCWGSNIEGQLGNDSVTGYSATPVPVMGLSGVTAIAGGVGHSCAVLGDSSVTCWGDTAVHDDGSSLATPVPVTGLSGAVAVAAGAGFSCALLRDGTVKCWGANNYGQLGPSSPDASSETPVPVTGLSNVVSIAAGAYHVCALLKDGTVRCWGDNSAGALGDGTTTRSATPVEPVGL